jgi:hypothetical protein
MTHKLRFSISEKYHEKDVMTIIDAPEPITASDMLEYFIRFCVVAGYQFDSVETAIVEYALPLLKEIAEEVESDD